MLHKMIVSAMAIAAVLSAPLHATEEVIDVQKVYYTNYDKGIVMIDGCEIVDGKEKCVPVNAPAEVLRVAIDGVIEHYDNLLTDNVKLKSMIDDQLGRITPKSELIDPETGIAYVLIKVTPTWVFPLEAEKAKNGIYDRLYAGLTFELDRLKRSKNILWAITDSNGDAVPDLKDKVADLYYTIRHGKLL